MEQRPNSPELKMKAMEHYNKVMKSIVGCESPLHVETIQNMIDQFALVYGEHCRGELEELRNEFKKVRNQKNL